jgi:hypothetical protein
LDPMALAELLPSQPAETAFQQAKTEMQKPCPATGNFEQLLDCYHHTMPPVMMTNPPGAREVSLAGVASPRPHHFLSGGVTGGEMGVPLVRADATG